MNSGRVSAIQVEDEIRWSARASKQKLSLRLPLGVTGWTMEAQRQAFRRENASRDLPARIARLQARIQNKPSNHSGVRLSELDPEVGRLIAKRRIDGQETILGHFDVDGYLISRFGPVATIPCISREAALPKLGVTLFLVERDGLLAVRKCFGNRVAAFVQEVEAILDLAEAGCSSPELFNLDWDRNSVAVEYVCGTVVRELLARAGARIRDRDVQRSFRARRGSARIRSARSVMDHALSGADVAAMAAAIRAIHSAGYVLQDVKYGNMILQKGTRRPFIIDFERALPLERASSQLARHLRALDERKFRALFGVDLY